MNDDLRTIQRVLEGEIEAFRLLVEKYQKPLFAMIHNMLSNRADCEDTAQETFLAAYLHLGSYDSDESQFSTWLFTIARNRCFNEAKRRRPVNLNSIEPSIALGHPADGLIAEEVAKVLLQHGIGRNWAKQALEIAKEQGRFTIFAMVDALTRMAGEASN